MPPLRLAPDARAGTAAAILGYPLDGPFDAEPGKASGRRRRSAPRTPTGTVRCCAASPRCAGWCAPATRGARWSTPPAPLSRPCSRRSPAGGHERTGHGGFAVPNALVRHSSQCRSRAARSAPATAPVSAGCGWGAGGHFDATRRPGPFWLQRRSGGKSGPRGDGPAGWRRGEDRFACERRVNDRNAGDCGVGERRFLAIRSLNRPNARKLDGSPELTCVPVDARPAHMRCGQHSPRSRAFRSFGAKRRRRGARSGAAEARSGSGTGTKSA